MIRFLCIFILEIKYDKICLNKNNKVVNMEISNELIIEQLKILNENISVLVGEKGAIVTSDDFVNLFITLAGTVAGGIITLVVFKKQERKRIKQELRLNFFKEYKLMYENFADDLVKLISSIKFIDAINLSELLSLDYTGIDNIEISFEKYRSCLENTSSIIRDTNEKIQLLGKYIESNFIITEKFAGTYKERIEKWNNIIYNREVFRQIESMNTKDSLSKTEVENYKWMVNYVMKLNDKLNELHKDMSKLHVDIENEFLQYYFKA